MVDLRFDKPPACKIWNFRSPEFGDFGFRMRLRPGFSDKLRLYFLSKVATNSSSLHKMKRINAWHKMPKTHRVTGVLRTCVSLQGAIVELRILEIRLIPQELAQGIAEGEVRILARGLHVWVAGALRV
jgi:hypothetical protein